MILEVSVPRDLIYSINHVAKAAEAMITAFDTGKTLRNKELEFFRRLTARKQVRDIQEILNKASNEKCIVTITMKEPSTSNLECCTPQGERALKILFPETLEKDYSKEEIEYHIISTIALTIINKWYD